MTDFKFASTGSEMPTEVVVSGQQEESQLPVATCPGAEAINMMSQQPCARIPSIDIKLLSWMKERQRSKAPVDVDKFRACRGKSWQRSVYVSARAAFWNKANMKDGDRLKLVSSTDDHLRCVIKQYAKGPRLRVNGDIGRITFTLGDGLIDMVIGKDIKEREIQVDNFSEDECISEILFRCVPDFAFLDEDQPEASDGSPTS